MTWKDVDRVMTYMEFFDDIPTFNKSKRKLIELAIQHFKNGPWEIVKRNYLRWGASTVGGYYMVRPTNRSRGIFHKYRGRDVFILCIKSGTAYDRQYIVAPIGKGIQQNQSTIKTPTI